jgi:hypothetical protein
MSCHCSFVRTTQKLPNRVIYSNNNRPIGLDERGKHIQIQRYTLILLFRCTSDAELLAKPENFEKCHSLPFSFTPVTGIHDVISGLCELRLAFVGSLMSRTVRVRNASHTANESPTF